MKVSSPGLADLDGLSHQIPSDLRKFLVLYGFGTNEITTKIEILQAEYRHLHDRNPIEHVSSRVKDPQGIIDKARRRGIGLGFWASLEHEIFYKYDRQVPDHLLRDLQDAAETADMLDQRMERLHREVTALADG